MTLSANDPNGFPDINRVEPFANGVLLGTAVETRGQPGDYPTGVYNYPRSISVPGGFSVTARATDNGGMSVDADPITVLVAAPNGSPLVQLTEHANGGMYTAPAVIALAATASDADGGVARVDFYAGTTLVGSATSAPYTVNWNAISAGTYWLTARATDNRGAVTASAPVYVQLQAQNQSPLVVLTAPAPCGSCPTGVDIPLAAQALDPDGAIVKVDFYGDATLLATANSAPYSAVWTSPPVGTHVLTARATDNQGATRTSAPVNITMSHPPPTASLTGPASGASFTAPASIPLAATAAASGATITKVDFYSGATLIGTSSSAPYTYTWSGVAAGSYALTARATDSQGASGTSSPVNITVTNPPPAVTLTAPANNSVYRVPATISMEATATDAVGTIAKVEFYDGPTLLGTVTGGGASLSATWTYSDVALGPHLLKAVATNNAGVSATSATANVIVTDLAIALSEPAAGQSYYAPAAIRITAAASGGGGAIARVAFFANGSLIGTVTSAPYTLLWSGVAAGDYTLVAQVIDGQGATITSAGVTVRVLASQLTFDAGLDGTSMAGEVVNVSGTVQAPPNSGVTVNGVIAAVDGSGRFYANNVALAPGSNPIVATLTTLAGQASTQSITISSSGPSPVEVRADPTYGIAPLAVTFTVSAQPGTTIQKVEFDWNGNGVIDFTLTEPAWVMTQTWQGVGTAHVVVKVTDTQGNVYTRNIPIVLIDPTQLDQNLRAAWSGLNSALVAGDKTSALRFLNARAQTKYGPVFDVLMAEMPQIVASYSPLMGGTMQSSTGDYAVVRDFNGAKRVYFIYYVQDADGVWRLDSM